MLARTAVPVALVGALVLGISLVDRRERRADLTACFGADVTTLDPQRMSWMLDLRMGRLLYEGLVRHDVFTPGYDIIPAAAESWEISADRRIYTFHLRSSARWSDGSPVTAEDFVFAWRRAMLPETSSSYIGFFHLIRGAEAFTRWRAGQLDAFGTGDDGRALWRRTLDRFAATVGVEAVEPATLRVELERPTPYFLDLCAFPCFYPVNRALVERHETPDGTTGRLTIERGWTKPGMHIGNGPFVLEGWWFKREMRLAANPRWWDAASLNVDSISVVSIDDPNARILAFRTGAIDWLSSVATSYRGDMWAEKLAYYDEHRREVERLRDAGLDQFEVDRRLPTDPRATIHAVPTFATSWWNFNCRPTLPDGRDNPFRDARVRRAFAMAVDKRALVEEIRRIGEPVADSIIPPGSIGGYEPPEGPAFDPEAARALLAEAGYAGGRGMPTVELLFNSDADHALVAQAIARNWEEHLGVSTSVRMKELKVFRDDVRTGRFMTARGSWFGDYGDPTTFLDLNRTGDGHNDRGYSNPEYDDLLARAETEPDPSERMRMLAEAERILVARDLPLIPLWHYVTMYMFDPHVVTGTNPHPRTTQNLFLFDVLGDGKGADMPMVVRGGGEGPAP